MYLRFNVKIPTLTTGSICGSVLTNNIAAGTTINIKQGTETLYTLDMGAIAHPYNDANDKYIKTNITGKEIKITSLGITGATTNRDFLLQIGTDADDRYLAHEGADITIEVIKSGYNTFSNSFTLYNYDIGNAGLGTTNNPELQIVLVQSNYATLPTILVLPYSSFTAWRKPFTSKVHIYRMNSATYNSVSYYDNGTLVLSTVNGDYCKNDDDLELTCSSTYNFITCVSSTVEVSQYQWLPTYEVQLDCVDNCSSTCTTILSDNTVNTLFDFGSVTTILQAAAAKLPFIGLGVRSTIVTADGITVLEETVYLNITYVAGTITILNTSTMVSTVLASTTYTHSSGEFNIPSIGDYVVSSNIEVLGYETRLVKAAQNTVPIGTYSVLNMDSDNSGAGTSTVDFDNLHAGSFNDYLDVFAVAAAGIPTDWGTTDDGIIAEVVVTGNPTANKYYTILKKESTADFGNISSNAVGGIFYSDGTAPTVWGALAVAGQGDYAGGALTEVDVVYTCYKSIEVTACYWTRITKTSCSAYTIENLSLEAVTYDISELGNDGAFTSIASGSIDLLSDLSISHVIDGIYQYSITRGDETVIFIIIVYCNFEACLLRFAKELICTCREDDCREKDWYNFNALIMNAFVYFSMLNSEYNFSFMYSAIDSDKISELLELNTIMENVVEYCEQCDSPCLDNNNCN